MGDLQSQLLQLIESQLPEQTAGVLRSYLKDTQNIKQELEASREALKVLQTRHTNLEQEHSKIKAELARYQNLDKYLSEREADLIKKETNAEVIKLNIQLASQKQVTDTIFSLVEKVFKNPTYVKHGLGQVPCTDTFTDSNGRQSSYINQKSVDLRTTETIE